VAFSPERCEAQAWALYLFLATVADAQGLSYYGEARLARLVKLELGFPDNSLFQFRAGGTISGRLPDF
jgi:hypothetical protein